MHAPLDSVANIKLILVSCVAVISSALVSSGDIRISVLPWFCFCSCTPYLVLDPVLELFLAVILPVLERFLGALYLVLELSFAALYLLLELISAELCPCSVAVIS
jgi:hypothetical protein